MLKEALDRLVELTKKSVDPRLLPLPAGADPSVQHIFNPCDGSTTAVTIDPPVRNHKVYTLESLKRAFVRYGGDTPDTDESDSVVWCSMGKIVLVVDDSEGSFRRDIVTMELKQSSMFEALKAIDGNDQTQEELVRFLRRNQANCQVSPAEFLKAVQSLKFTHSQTTEGQLSSVAKSTFGKSTMSEVTGAATIPETVEFTFSPWPNGRVWDEGESYVVTIRCTVFVDASEGTITLDVMPGEFDAAEARALDALCDRVANHVEIEAGRVFAGTVA